MVSAWSGVETDSHGLTQLVVSLYRSPRRHLLAIFGPGAIVGELAMIDGLPRSASVQAIRDCEFTLIKRAAFTEKLHQHPEL
jgi:CRP/FNR family transcriptional regulator, cyclic AMP receptor protein